MDGEENKSGFWIIWIFGAIIVIYTFPKLIDFMKEYENDRFYRMSVEKCEDNNECKLELSKHHDFCFRNSLSKGANKSFFDIDGDKYRECLTKKTGIDFNNE